jgi:hypothetical protein
MFVAVWMIGCQSSGSGTMKGGRGKDPITEEEIKNSNQLNLYDVVRILRPMFFSFRGPKSILLPGSTTPFVYLDGARYGDVEILKSMPLDNVQEIRYLDPLEATALYGVAHDNGIIMVTTKKLR